LNETGNDNAPFNDLRNKFEGHELPPDAALWKSISKDLEIADSRFVKRKLIIWRILTFLSLGILLLFLVFNYSSNEPKTPESTTENDKPTLDHLKAGNSKNHQHELAATKVESESGNLGSTQKTTELPTLNQDRATYRFNKSSFTQSQTLEANVFRKDAVETTAEMMLPAGYQSTSTSVTVTKMDHSAPEKTDQFVATPVTNQLTDQLAQESGMHQLFPRKIGDGLITDKQVIALSNPVLPDLPKSVSKLEKAFFVRVGVTPSYTHRILSNQQNGVPTVFTKEYYNSREAGRLNYNYSAELGYRLNSNFSLRTGVGMANYSTSFSGLNMPVQYDTLNGLFIANTSNGEVEFNDSDFEGDEDEENEQNNSNNEELEDVEDGQILLSYSSLQKISYVQIPLSFEAGINRNKWRYYATIGMTFNFLTKQKIEMAFDNIGIIRQDNSLPIRTFNVGSTLGMGIEYRFLKAASVYLEPSFNYNFLNINRLGSVRSNPYSVGTNLGFKIYF